MSIKWKLRKFLAEKHRIYRVVDLQRCIMTKAGVRISVQHLSVLVNKRPSSIKLSTMEIICTALDCQLGDFCEVVPSPAIRRKKDTVKRLARQNTPKSKKDVYNFPDPHDY